MKVRLIPTYPSRLARCGKLTIIFKVIENPKTKRQENYK